MTENAHSPVESMLLSVFREQRGRIWGFLLRATATGDVAEDLLQEAFVRIWDRRRSLGAAIGAGDTEGMRRYVWRVVRNLVIDEIRLRQRRRRVTPEDGGNDGPRVNLAVDPAPRADETLEWQEGLEVVRETVARVKNAEGRRCLELWLEGMSPERISRLLSLGPGRVRGLLQRTRSEVILRAGNRLRARRGVGT